MRKFVPEAYEKPKSYDCIELRKITLVASVFSSTGNVYSYRAFNPNALSHYKILIVYGFVWFLFLKLLIICLKASTLGEDDWPMAVPD